MRRFRLILAISLSYDSGYSCEMDSDSTVHSVQLVLYIIGNTKENSQICVFLRHENPIQKPIFIKTAIFVLIGYFTTSVSLII